MDQDQKEISAETYEYIKMNEKAISIQEIWQKKPCDIFYFKNYNSAISIMSVDKVKILGVDEDLIMHWWTCIWLPRVDNLQDIVQKEDETALALHNRFHSFVRGFGRIAFCKGSMEQLWLGFVMKDLEDTIWDGDEWVPCV